MKIYTIGYTKRPAKEFFGILREYGIKQVVDIRENNTSQLAGFTKREDLRFFVKEILDGSYIHLPKLAPDREIRKNYKKSKDWQKYESNFLRLMEKRGAIIWLKQNRDIFIEPFVLLCSEPLPDRCHRRLVAELLKENIFHDVEVVHL
ncbi:MAG: DUF488 domain-containing protein [Nitrospirota bacterium]